jgi:small-conductance mechanosensitive channel
MALLRRIAGGMVFVAALITFLLAATGTIGGWIAKATIDETTLAVMDTLTDALDLAIQTIDSTIAGGEQRLNLVQTALPALRAERANGPVAQQMEQTVTAALQPALEQLTTRAQRLSNGLERFNQRVEQLNRLPFVDTPTFSGALATLDEQLSAALTQGEIVLTAIESRDNVLLQSAGEQMEQRLGQARATLNQGSARIATTRAALIDVREALTFWSTVSTTAISALLVIFAVGQISLAVHAWGWMRGRRLLGDACVR